MFTNYLFKVKDSTCLDWIGFDGSFLYVNHKNRFERGLAFDHAYRYPCNLAQFNNLLAAGSRGKFYNDWFRFVYTAEESTLRNLAFTYDTYKDTADIETGLPKTAGAFQRLQFYSRITGQSAFEKITSVLAVVPETYPGAAPLPSDKVNPELVGLWTVPLECSTIVQDTQARIMTFIVQSMICSMIAVEDYKPVQGQLKDVGSCILQIPGLLEV